MHKGSMFAGSCLKLPGLKYEHRQLFRPSLGSSFVRGLFCSIVWSPCPSSLTPNHASQKGQGSWDWTM